MAITNDKSDQMQARADGKRTHASQVAGKVRSMAFTFTKAAQGDADSDVELVRLPGGPIRIIRINLAPGWSAMGAARTMDLGHAAYADPDGNLVADNPVAFDADRDVANAGSAILTLNTRLSSKDGITVKARIQGNTFDVGETLAGDVEYVAD